MESYLSGLSGWSGIALAAAAAIVIAYVVTLITWAARRQEREAARDAGAAGKDLPTWATPRGRPTFIVLAALFAALVWIVAWSMAPDKRAFLASREWQAQPLYLLAHFATVRVFASILAANFVAGASHLEMGAANAVRAVRHRLGIALALPALIVALPFIAGDLRYFLSARYAKLSGGDTPLAVDWMMFGVWTLEWLLNALVCVMLASFLWLNVIVLRRYKFTQPIHVVLMERHYRPFLRMSAQGATVVLAFSIITAAYIIYAGGEITDYLGLVFTIGLLAVCFLPPWFLVRHKVNRSVREDLAILQKAVNPMPAQAFVASIETNPGAASRDYTEAVAIMRMLHLERMHGDVGRREATDVAVRLLAPAATAGWQLWQNGAVLLERFLAWFKLVLG